MGGKGRWGVRRVCFEEIGRGVTRTGMRKSIINVSTSDVVLQIIVV